MTIEIFGGGFLNKGAELMLRTTVARLRQRQPDLRLAVEPQPTVDYERRAELRLAHLFPTLSLYPPALRRVLARSSTLTNVVNVPLEWLLPAAADPLLGLVRRRRCEALIDISGYAFGDGFHWRRTKNAALRTGAYARRHKPVIFMPQMFGPFNDRRVRRYFRRCCDHATRIYAREPRSFDAVREVIGDDPRLRLAPDITIFCIPPADLVVPDLPAGDYACIVPNERMLDQGGGEWSDRYVSRLVAVGQRMHSRGLRPALVVHSDDPGDAELALQITEQLEAQIGTGETVLFRHRDPFVLKAFIAKSRLLVGSRFHSLVAALSSGVPGVALGWAHKYEMLAADFGVPELIHRGTDEPDHLLALVDQLADRVENDALRTGLVARRAAMKAQSDALWDDVFQLLKLPE